MGGNNSGMKCPACSRDLTAITAGTLTVDACKGGCGGLWFDNFELKKVDEEHEADGHALLDIPVDAAVKVDHGERRKCPKCPDTVMMRHFFSPKRSVEVDRCPGCNGYWLDPGELSAIRGEYSSEVERQKAMEDHFSDVFDAQMAALKARSEVDLEPARRVATMLRFICPSYYLPGKQDWGAF